MLNPQPSWSKTGVWDRFSQLSAALASWSKRPRAYDAHRYKARHVIKNLFARLKQFRRIATRLRAAR